jgi:electron transfer flavoprotein alpha/beta subunit
MVVDLVIAGRESIDYNGGMVPGMIAAMTGKCFVVGMTQQQQQPARLMAVKKPN